MGSPKRSVWSLTEKGAKIVSHFTDEDAVEIERRWATTNAERRKAAKKGSSSNALDNLPLRGTCYWIIPSNTNKFDIAETFEKFGFVDWKQKNNFQVGDVVYIYSTKPDQCVQYRCCVTDVDLTFDQSQSDMEFWNDKYEFYLGKEHNRYCRFVLNGEIEQGKLDLANLIANGLTGAPQSAITISGELTEYIEGCFKPHTTFVDFVDEAESQAEFMEGSASLVTRSFRQRNRNARQKCLEVKGVVCSVCGFDFEQHYGGLGKGFIHVHHKMPISEREGNYKIDVCADLVPVCPNCHAMLHKEVDGKCLSVEELREIFKP